MAKVKRLPPSVESFRDTIARFTRQSNRGTALIAAAWIDDALKELLRAYFRPDKGIIERFLEHDGAAGTFNARIQLAYLLDLIEPSVYRDLELVRKIRNDFAHSRDDLRFRDPPVRDRCRQLHAARACELGGGPCGALARSFLLLPTFLLNT